MKRILVVEDDPDLLLGLKDNLELEGYEVTTAIDGNAAVASAMQLRPDAIVLDLMLPGISGFEVCRVLRTRQVNVPVIMLSARGQDTDKLRGLQLGADDYVTKPFSIVELLARLAALLRRAGGPATVLEECRFGAVEVNFRLMRARKGRRTVPMSGLEFEVLRYLVQRRGETVSRDQLLHDVWGYHESAVTRSVDNLIARLRHKLELHPDRPQHLLTIHGVGYRFVE